MTDINQIIRDPNFIALPLEEQRKGLSELDPEFKNMFPAQQDKILNAIVSQGGTITGRTAPLWVEEAAKTGTELLGLGVGGAVGGPLGAGVGYAVTKNLFEILNPNKPFKEDIRRRLIQLGIDVPTGIAIEAGGQIIGKGVMGALGKLGKKLPFAGKGLEPESKELMALGKQYGVYQQVPDITGHAGQGKWYSGLNMLPTSASVMQKDAAKSILSLKGLSDRLLKKFGFSDISKSRYQTGAIAQEGMSIAKKDVQNQMDELYEIARTKAGDAPVTFGNFGKVSNQIEKSTDYRLLPKEYRETVNNVADLFKEGEWTYKIVEDERRAIAKAAMGEKDYRAKSLLWKLHDAVEKDMEEAAITKGVDVHKAFVNARDFASKNFYGTFRGTGVFGEKPIERKILETENLDNIVGIMKTVSGIKEIKKTIPPNYFQQIKEGLLAEIYEKSMKTVNVGPKALNYLDPKILDSNINSYGKEYIRELLNNEEIKFLGDYVKLGERFNLADKIFGNATGTSGAWYMGQLMTGAGIGGILGGNIGSAVRGALAFTGIPYILAKATVSPAARNYMLYGLGTMPQTIGKSVGTPMSYGGARGFQEFLEKYQQKKE